MTVKDKAWVLRTVDENKINFIRIWFTDVLGMLKSFAITPEELPTALEEGMGFDGSSIEGFARIEESDMIALPDPETFVILPWHNSEDRPVVARMIADIKEPTGEPYCGDPRLALRRVVEKAKVMGFKAYMGPELEFFLFKNSEGTEVLDAGGYFDLTPLDVASDLRRDCVVALEKMGIKVEYSHHEGARSQHEMDLR